MTGCTAEIAEQLLPEVENYLNITWQDDATDRKISGIISRGIARLSKLCGGEPDFTVPGDAQELLYEYCRYARDEALDVFENNYRSMLLTMQNDRKLARHAEDTVST